MRRADARSAQIGGPKAISHSFHLREYSGESKPLNLRFKLDSKLRCKSALDI